MNNRALVYQFTGARWVQGTVTPAEGYRAPYLSSVSCASSNACTAVGYALPEESSGSVPFVARWNGSAWSAQEITSPVGTEESELLGVSCPSEAVCVAVGDRKNSAGVWVNYSALWSQNRWSNLATPSAQESTHSVMTGVSCGSDTSCLAGGWYDTGAGTKPFSIVLANGLSGGWTLQLRARFGTIEGITCTSPAFCAAVGEEYGPPTAETWNGSRWTPATTPELGDVTSGDLKAVSCVSATDCTAVGVGYAVGGNRVTLAERWSGQSWTKETTPQAGEKASELTGVSCVALSGCSAVGATKANGKAASLIETRSETTPRPPALETGVVSAIAPTSATLNAVVNPNGGEVSSCELEYGTSTSYGQTASCTPSPGSGTGAVAVSAAIAGLATNTTYHFRISATNAGGTSNSSDETLKTLPDAPPVVTKAPWRAPRRRRH